MRRRVLVVMVTGLCLVLATGCFVATEVQGSGPRLVILGGRLSHGAAADLVDAHASRFATSVTGYTGGTYANMAGHAGRVAAGAPAFVVLELGAADVASDRTIEEIEADLAVITGRFPTAACVLPTTIDEAAVPIETRDRAVELNAHLRATSGHLVDWDAHVGAQPDGDLLYTDASRTALSAAGVDAMVSLQSEQLADCVPTVAVVGDSITYMSRSAIVSALTAGGFSPVVFGMKGYDTSEFGADPYYLPALVAAEPDIVIFEFGTNDVGNLRSGTDTAVGYGERLSGYAALFPGACVAATTVTSHRGWPAWDDTASSLNAQLRARFGSIVEWDETEWQARNAGQVLVETEDHVHPTPAGSAVLAGLDLDAARRCVHDARVAAPAG